MHRDAKHTLSVPGAALLGRERACRRSILYHDDLVRIVKLKKIQCLPHLIGDCLAQVGLAIEFR